MQREEGLHLVNLSVGQHTFAKGRHTQIDKGCSKRRVTHPAFRIDKHFTVGILQLHGIVPLSFESFHDDTLAGSIRSMQIDCQNFTFVIEDAPEMAGVALNLHKDLNQTPASYR